MSSSQRNAPCKSWPARCSWPISNRSKSSTLRAGARGVVTEFLQTSRSGHSTRHIAAQLPDAAGGAAAKGGEIKRRRVVQQSLLSRQTIAPLFNPFERGKARCTRPFGSLQRFHQGPTQSTVIWELLHQRSNATKCRLVVLLRQQSLDGPELRELRLGLGRRLFPGGFTCHGSGFCAPKTENIQAYRDCRGGT